MGYTLADLDVFVPLTVEDPRDGTAYIELHPRERASDHECWLEGSMLVRDAAFDFFVECFHAADPDFDYFAFQRLCAVDIQRLATNLQTFLSGLSSGVDRTFLFSNYNSLFGTEIWDELETSTLAPAVRNCGERMQRFVADQTRDTQCLWVLGM